MAGLEADTSSYPKASLPVSPLEVAGKFGALEQQKQQIESGALTIDKQKLDLMSQQFGVMNQELSTMIDDPNITKPQAAERLKRIATTLKLPPVAVDHMMTELNQAPDVKSFSMNALRRGMATMEKYGVQLGTTETQTDNANVYQGVRASPEKGGGFTPSTALPVQLPPGTPTVNNQRVLPNGQPNPNYLQPQVLGPAGPPGVVPVPRQRPSLPVEPISGPTGPTVQTGHNFDQRFAGAPVVTGAPPGTAAAIGAVSEQSGKDFATDLTRAKNYQADLQPDLAVLDIVKGKGPGDFGPGTDALNQAKKLAVTWLPNVNPKLITDSSDYDVVKKYLIQGARGSGNTGSDNQLAAAFEANPNTTMNTATIENIVKTRVALRKMQAAQTLMAAQQNIPKEQYSEWIARNQNQFDPRAFGYDLMNDEAKNKLRDTISVKDKNGDWVAKKGKEKEFQKFEKSISFANDAGLIEPPGKK